MAERRNETPAEALERVSNRIKTEGIDAAVEALIGVCRDPKAAAPAKSSAGTSLLRAAGLFDRSDDDDAKEPHQMTAAELERKIQRLKHDASTAKGLDVARGAGVFD